MFPCPQALQCLVVAVAGWINQQQRDVIDYLQEENRVLREQFTPRRLRFTDVQRRRLAAKAQAVGRRTLCDLGTLVLKRDVPIVRVDQVWSTDSGFLWRGERLVSRLPA